MSGEVLTEPLCQWRFVYPHIKLERACDRPALSGSQYCLLHKRNRTPQEVRRFVETIKKHVTEKGDLNFEGYVFPPNWKCFRGRVLIGADFSAAEFEGDADFSRGQFLSSERSFHAARFYGAHFRGRANFSGTEIEGWSDFSYATFDGDADFCETLFGEWAMFSGARFAGKGDFQGARFAGPAEFSWTRFDAEALFVKTKFMSMAVFNEAVFCDACAWHEAFFNAVTAFRDVAQEAGCRFVLAFPKADGKEVRLETRFARPTTGSDLFRLAKETARRAGDYRLAGDYFYYERKYADLAKFQLAFYGWRRTMLRLGWWELPKVEEELQEAPPNGVNELDATIALPVAPAMSASRGRLITQPAIQKSWLRPYLEGRPSWGQQISGAFGLLVGWALFGYGERPWRVFRWSLIVVCVWALAYWGFGLVRAHGSMYAPMGFWRYVYFSFVTFTTLGFGDFEPVKSGLGMFLAASEAFIGMFMMALFVVSVAKRFTRG